MTYDEIIEQLEITKSKIKEIARNEYGGESWNDDLDALTEAADIVADYSKATAQAAELRHSEGAIKRRILDLGINKKPVRCPPPKMDGGRSGNLVPHGRRRLRFHTNRREAEPDSAGHAWKIRTAAESGI